MPERATRVAVLWSRFGPYHLARLEAAGAAFSRRGGELFGIEIARKDSAYGWDVLEGSRSFNRVTLFGWEDYSAVPAEVITKAVSRALREIRPSAVAVNGWSSPEARAALRWCVAHHVPAVLMSDSKEDDANRTVLKESAKRLIIGALSAALVGGGPHARYLVNLGMPPERIFCGYDVVDNEHFRLSAQKLRCREEAERRRPELPERYFLTCCRFVPKKNLFRLLDAYASYRAHVPSPWGLVICGGGELEAELKGRAGDLGLDDVRWPGFVQYDQLPFYYGLSSAFILPSTTEQWGLVVNEAMASGLPVLVSEKAGCRYDLVEEGRNGYLFDPFDVHDMADAMRRISAMSDEERGAIGRRSEEIIADWDPQRFARGLWQAVQAARSAPGRKPGLIRRIGIRFLTHPRLCRRKPTS